MKTCTVTSNVGPPTEFEIPELGDPCEKCRAKPSTQEVMIMVERPGGVVYYCDECAAPPIAPAPLWSTEPPVVTEKPQFYWFRLGPGAKRIPVEVFELGGQSFCNTFGQIKKLSTSRDGGEWWPVRIEPPR